MTDTLTLNKGGAKASPAKGKNRDKLKKVLKAAEAVHKDPESKPQVRELVGMNYAGKDMASQYPDKKLKHADFTNADLSGANFEGFNLQGSTFRNTKVTDTNFMNADLRWSIWTNCDTKDDAIWCDDEGHNMADVREVAGL